MCTCVCEVVVGWVMGVAVQNHFVIINNNKKFEVVTDCGNGYFDYVVIATGGHASYNICKYLGHTIVEPKKALVGLKTQEDLSTLAGVAVKVDGDDLLFTHQGISGPWTYKLSSIKARDNFPYIVTLDFCGEIDLQDMLNKNPHKSIKNLLSEVVPKSLAEYILKRSNISGDFKSHKINGKQRDTIMKYLRTFSLTIVSTIGEGEVVTAGGVYLKEVNSKTMQSALVPGIFFCGEVLDIDGFCGGFNLQNCWSTGFIAAQTILEKI